MSESYTKLAQDIVYSTIWAEDGDTCKLWITLLALKDKNGIVTQNLSGIERITKIPIEKCRQAIRFFLSPDPMSSTKELEGRRLEALPGGGWRVVSHEKYQEYGWSEDKKKFERERKAKQRENKRHRQTSEQPDLPSKGGGKWVKPTMEECRLNAAKIGLAETEVGRFFDFYESNGWRVGKNPMKSTAGAMANWKRNYDERRYENSPNSRSSGKPNPRNFGIVIGPTNYATAVPRKQRELEAKRAEAQKVAGQVAADGNQPPPT